MHYLSAQNLSKSFGIKSLFENLNFHVNQGDKIAIVAANGTGKSTLLNILAGKEISDSGSVLVAKDVKTLLLQQDHNFNENETVFETILHRPLPLLELLKKYLEYADKNDFESPEFQVVLEEINTKAGPEFWELESNIHAILQSLEIHDFNQKVLTLSGGQKKRLALAQVLIDLELDPSHTLLIMDEPTNHLDIQMIDWLEAWLKKDNKTLLLVTHDRHFLDQVCNKIWELDHHHFYVHQGNYAYFLEQKSQREENQEAYLSHVKNTYRRELEWMRKQPKARTTKSKSRIDNFHELKKIASQRIEHRKIELASKMTRLGGKILEIKKVSKSFGPKKILDSWEYTFNTGEKVGLVGKNGVGKTTLINILLGLENFDNGKRVVGETVVFGYFSQNGLEITQDQRVIEYIKDIAEFFELADGRKLQASEFLKLFLFSPEQQFTYISKLSGGERKRLQLISTLFKNPNFLILDEPTNDLDLLTQNILEEFLENFKGCILLVSHDRHFMNKIVDHILVMEGEGKILDFNGNYDEYIDWKNLEEESKEIEKIKKIADEKTNLENLNAKKMTYNEKREFEKIDLDLINLNSEKEKLEKSMVQENIEFSSLQKMAKDLDAINLQISEKEMRWLELSEKE